MSEYIKYDVSYIQEMMHVVNLFMFLNKENSVIFFTNKINGDKDGNFWIGTIKEYTIDEIKSTNTTIGTIQFGISEKGYLIFKTFHDKFAWGANIIFSEKNFEGFRKYLEEILNG